MSRKDYVLIAEVLKTVRQDCDFELEESVVDSVAARLAFEFKADNSRFDTQRFLKATGA